MLSFCIILRLFANTILMSRLKLYTIIGILFTLITGTISHFIYEWSGNNFLLGFFFPVNESTWEHMKLCFFPMLFYAFYMNRKMTHAHPCVTFALLFGTLSGTFLIPVIFYTYSGILGRNFLILDIATFILSVLAGFRTAYRLSLSCRADACTTALKLLTAALAVCFFLFTYHPPALGIFISPE